jgi:NAD(P)-dependent dehydrogenase (short-subunit alcohol dehydrogenase family)
MNRLEGKVAMITGSASGIGKTTAELFAKEGANVIITTRRKVAEGTELAETIKKEGGEATFIKLDVRKESDWRVAIDEAIRIFGKLNILVNNAGITFAKTIEDTSLDEWNSVMETNSTGVFLGTKYAIGAMKNNGEQCSIVNISSVMVYVGDPELAAYNVSKGAVTVLSKTAALHCGGAGYTIRVNSVYPGFIHTQMADIEAEERGMTIEEFMEEFVKYHPIGYLGRPDDVAYAVLYLASDESKFVTGAELAVDGGWSAK